MAPVLLAVLALAAADRYEAEFDAADRVAVVAQDFVVAPDRRSSEQVERVLFDSSAAADVAALRRALRATPEAGICACMATTEIRLYRGNDLLATAYYLGERVKGGLWDGDATLVDHEALLDWFDARGMTDPRRVELESRERARADAALEARFLAAMPEALRPYWEAERERMRRDPQFEAPKAWRGVLQRAYPDAVERAAGLLRWFGYGGPWTGYHAEESVPEALLRGTPVPTLLAAVEENAAEAPVLEGAARLFSLHDFGDARVQVPPHFRRLLLAQVAATGDADKRDRAESALGEER